jgi:hypothetical protein
MIFPINVRGKARWLVKNNVNASKKPVAGRQGGVIGKYMHWRPSEINVPNYDNVSGTFSTLGAAQHWLGRG